MLNANAKAFVPGGAGGSIGSTTFTPSGVIPQPEPSLFRYSLTQPHSRPLDIEASATTLPALNLLLSKRLLSAVAKGGSGITATQQFVTEFFATATNSVQSATSGFLLSRELLSLSALEAVHDANEREGYVIPLLDVPSIAGADVSSPLSSLWELFFAQFGKDFRLTAMGYVCLHTANESTSVFRHYLFACTTPKKSQLVQLSCSSFDSVSRRTYEVRRVIPFVLNARLPVATIVNVDCESSPEEGEGVTVGKTVSIEFHPNSAIATVNSVKAAEKELLAHVMDSRGCRDCTEMIVINVRTQPTTVTTSAVEEIATTSGATSAECESDETKQEGDSQVTEPSAAKTSSSASLGMTLFDLIALIRHLNDIVLGSICGVRTDATTKLPEYWRFPITATVGEIVQAKKLLAPGLGTGGMLRFPGGLFASTLTPEDFSAVAEEFAPYADTLQRVRKDPTWLSRSALLANIDTIAAEQYKTRRRSIGVPVFVIADSHGKLFAIDCEEGNMVTITTPHTCWSNSLIAPQGYVFEGTLCATFRGERQYRIIVHDVLCSSQTDVTGTPFPQRWSSIDSLALEEETNWAHGSPSNLVILRAAYVPLTQSEVLLMTPQVYTDHPILGIDIINCTRSYRDATQNFKWCHSDSVTATFIADEVEVVSGSGDLRVMRAYLSSRAEERDEEEEEEAAAANTSSNGLFEEYVDFHYTNAPEVEAGSVIECMLRRSVDKKTHWWELLRSFIPSVDTAVASKRTEVVELLASPLLSMEELRWLLNCSNYLCGRCKSVSDTGKLSPTLRSFMCRPCWETTGHGDCVSCAAAYVPGSRDALTERFYCDSCWSIFTTPRSFAAGAPPPPPDATFMKIVSTRVISLFIDYVGMKGPTTDVLELCSGGSVLRKWINAGTQRYLGIDTDPRVVDESRAIIKNSQQRQLNPPTAVSPVTSSLPSSSKFDVINADVFKVETWTDTLAKAHPAQFHTITCFSGLNQIFATEKTARDMLFSISNALVPNGLFLGSLMITNALYRKGKSFENSVFQCKWGDDATPRLGATYDLKVVGDTAMKTKYVIPLDVLAAFAHEFNLSLLEQQMTYGEMLAGDGKWTRAMTAEEKEFLGFRMLFAFRKNSQKVAASSTS